VAHDPVDPGHVDSCAAPQHRDPRVGHLACCRDSTSDDRTEQDERDEQRVVVPGVGDVVGNRPILAATAVAATLPLAARRRFPLAVLVAVLSALALQQVLTTPTDGWCCCSQE
jgi:hypothetical protein